MRVHGGARGDAVQGDGVRRGERAAAHVAASGGSASRLDDASAELGRRGLPDRADFRPETPINIQPFAELLRKVMIR